jgi:hypothetical protein
MCGTVISVPINVDSSQLPLNDADAPPCVIHLVDGSTHNVSPDYLALIVNEYSSSSNKICLPSWLGNSRKVVHLQNGTYLKGIMEWDLDNFTLTGTPLVVDIAVQDTSLRYAPQRTTP